MGDLQGIKKAIKGEVTEIIDSNFKEFQSKVFAWAAKLDAERKNFERIRQQERQRIQFEDRTLLMREAEIKRELQFVQDTIKKLNNPI